MVSGGIDPVKALQSLLKDDTVSVDSVLLLDKMYLQKPCDYHDGSIIGKDEDGNFFNGILVFIIVGPQKSIPYVIKAIPKVKMSGALVKREIEESLRTMQKTGFKIRAIISDNHSTNVLGFSQLICLYGNGNADENYFIYFEGQKVYTMFNSVHLIKNVRNNLLNHERFIFPPFEYDGFTNCINVTDGEISWDLLHKVNDKDIELSANLRKAPKLNYKTLHPGDNKQDVTRALKIFHPTNSAAINSYVPLNCAPAEFLQLFQTWWRISNSKIRFSNNPLGNAAVLNNNMPQFLRMFANWIESWESTQLQGSNRFALTKQTSTALVITSGSTASLLEDLLNEGYKYVLTSRLQSDPVERHLSKYRQMSGGRFLVALREIQSAEKFCR